MNDFLIRAHSEIYDLRIFICQAQNLCQEVSLSHSCDETVTQYLSEAIVSGLLLSPLLVNEERFTLRWQYEGMIETITVDVAVGAKVRAFPMNSSISGRIPEEIFGISGKVGVVKSNPYRTLASGMTLADLLQIDLDLATYFNISEQLPTAIKVSVGKKSCSGILIQGLPGTDLELLNQIQNRMNQDNFTEVLSDIDKETNLYDILSPLIPVEMSIESTKSTVEHLEIMNPETFCVCSKEKVLSMLKLLPNEELEDMIKKDGGAQIDCQFCAKKYSFEAADLRDILSKKS